jgi:outer membrane beta-barrel protein
MRRPRSPKPLLLALSLAAVGAALATPGAARAQAAAEEGDGEAAPSGGRARTETGARDRIKSVQRRHFVRGGRFELQPYVGLHVNDAFQNNLLLGAAANYHFAESLGIEARVAYSLLNSASESLKSVRAESEVNPLQSTLSGLAVLNFAFAPIYGKFSLFADSIVHFDLGLSAGAGVVFTQDSGGLVPEADAKTGLRPTFDLGIGSRLVLAEWLTVSLDLRDYLYVATYGPEYVEQSRGDGVTISRIRQNVLFTVGASLFFPMSGAGEEL